MSKKALITGITGQDGAYLAELLVKKGYAVYGGYRRSSTKNIWRLEYLGVQDKVILVDFDMLEYSNMFETIKEIMPDEIYNLAAQSFVGTSFKQPLITTDINARGVLMLLDIVKTLKPDCKIYQASTSEMFGKVQEVPQTETTPFYPRSPYGISKLFAHWMIVNYRESYNMFCCSGILFNHESPLRGSEFVTKKIAASVAKMKHDPNEVLRIGNLYAERDWGYAKEYVEGMYLMMQHSKPDTFVLATGEKHSVKDFINEACNAIGMEIVWEGSGADEVGKEKANGKVRVVIDKEFYRPAEVDHLIGNTAKAQKELGWKPKTKFKDLVALMIEDELKKHLTNKK